MAEKHISLRDLAHDLWHKADVFLWGMRAEELPLWKRTLIRTLQIAYAVGRDLAEGHLSLRAMSLVYYTVIAMVPLLALTFAVLKGLGVHNALEPVLLGVLEPFLAEYSVEITENVVSYVDNVRVDVLSFLSLGILLYMVLTMMKQMEMSFNFIWSVHQARSLASRVSEYLFAVIVSPLLILISVGIASYVNTNFFVRYLETLPFGGTVLQVIATVTPFFFMSAAFAFAYTFIPNTRVHFRSAFIGGIVTAIAWQTMAYIFQNFITVYSANAAIYAAFFAVILLMLFIYLGWLMLLIGSSIAFYHQYPAKTRSGRKPLVLSIAEQEEVTLTVAYLIIKRFKARQTPWSLAELIDHTHLSAQAIEDALATLHSIHFLSMTVDDPPRYLPTATVHNESILNLRARIRRAAADTMQTVDASTEQIEIRQFLNQGNDLLFEQLGHQRFSTLGTDRDTDPASASAGSHTRKKAVSTARKRRQHKAKNIPVAGADTPPVEKSPSNPDSRSDSPHAKGESKQP